MSSYASFIELEFVIYVFIFLDAILLILNQPTKT